jgi:glutaredoxin
MPGGMLMNRAVIYAISTCPACIQLKKDLTGKKIEFEEKQVDNNQAWLDEALHYGDIVPMIVYEDGRIEINPTGIIG